MTRSTSAMWQRRPDHGDAFTAVAGVGDGWAAGAGAGGAPLALERVPVCADLGPGARVACAGPGADAMIRSLLVQLAVTTGPADWQLLVVGDRPDRWSWLTGLPHLVCTDDAAVVHDDVVLGDRLGTGRPGDHRHLLVLTDATGSLAVRTSALRRLLHARPDAALLVAAPAAGDVPAACTQVWITTSDGRVKVDGTPPSPNDRPIGPGTFGPWHLHGLGPAGARLAVGALAPWSDPEAPDDHERRLADAVDLDRLWRERGVRLEPAGVLAHWRRGRDANGAIADAAPIGSAADGTVDLDLVRDGPHGLIAGTTGSGKSELLRTIVLSSAIAQPPDRLAFVLVDFKGGATFDDLARLPHVVGVVTDLEPRLAERVLRSLRAEVTAREHLLRSHGCADLDTARRRLDVPVVARLVIVVDEFAALALEHPELLHGLVDIARRGRSLGIHLLLATQRPGGVVSDEIRTNTDLRIALRLHEPSEAIDVVGDAAPASIRRSSAGRAVVRLGPGELVTFQTARAVDTARTIDQIVAAAREGGLARPSRPWCDPLPDELLPGDPRLADGALGLVDRPDQQRQHPFDWRPADGHLLVAGAVGSGVTTALAGLAVRRLASDAELVVIDAIGGSRWDEVAVHPRCAVVARLHDVELVDRALRRAATPPPAGGRLVVIDGIGVLRRELDGVHRADAHDRLDALLVTTPPGVTLLLGSDAVDGLAPAIVGRCARRLVAHLHDPTAAALLGLRVGDVPPAVPGRVVDTVDATVVQLAPWPAAELARAASPDAVPVDRVRVLPPSIDVAQVADGAARRDDEQWWTAVGLAHHDLSTACVTIARGEHAVVVGPPRSGRTNALAVLRRGWTIARPDAAQVVVSPRRVPASELAAVARDALAEVRAEIERGREVLLVVDDAERLPDDTGELAALAASPPDGLVIVAACRPEALRAAHGSWVTAMRRHRRGVVFAGCDELDVESLGVRLPRRPPLAARPGLAWLIGDGEAQLAQLATIGP
ncbi:MAG: hypothetical protein KDB40_23950 [Acidimicrobiales bacterium]|nr:hypothetical protein [Acidimicrobiales bacterium]